MGDCKNCGAALTGEYCAQCGQRDLKLTRPIADLLSEIVQETFDFDGRAARSVAALFRRPGLLTREFLTGRRRDFTSPLRLYLVVSVLFFIVASWVTKQGILIEQGTVARGSIQDQAQFVSDGLPKLMFLLLPMFAALLKVAFWDRFYFEHLIHSLHLHSAGYAVLAFLLPLERVADANWPLLILQALLLTWLLAYCFVSFRRVYEVGWGIAVIKTLVVLFFYLAALLLSLELATRVSG